MQSHLLCHAIRKNDGVKIHHFFSKSYKNGFMLTAPEKLCNNMKYAQAYRCIFRCYCTLTITSAFFLLFSIWKRKKPRSFCKKKIAVVHLQLEFVSLMYIIKCLCMSIVYPTLQSKPSVVFFSFFESNNGACNGALFYVRWFVCYTKRVALQLHAIVQLMFLYIQTMHIGFYIFHNSYTCITVVYILSFNYSPVD